MFSRRFPTALACLALLVALAPAAHAQDAVSAVLHVEGAQGMSEMKITAADENLRLDMQSPQGEASMVWAGGSMLMIMHSQRMYMEFTQEMMERMRSMMGNVPGMPDAADSGFSADDMTGVTFNRTGNTDTINGMSAFEVEVVSPDRDTASLWLTEDTDIGLFQVMARMSDALSSVTMPGMQQSGGMMQMNQFMGLARAQGLPDGAVVRIVNEEGGGITLGEVVGGPFPDSTWTAPDGYTKQSMPFQD